MNGSDDNSRRALIAGVCAFIVVVGSWLWSLWSSQNPIVIDDQVGILQFIDSLVNPTAPSNSAW